MIKTQDPQVVAQALKDDKVVHHFAAGRNFRVNTMGKGKYGWFMTISHKSDPHAQVVDVSEGDEFTILTQAQYSFLLDRLHKEIEEKESKGEG